MADDKVVQITLSAKNLTPAEFDRARQQLSGIKAEAAVASEAAAKMGKLLAGAFSLGAIKSFAMGLMDTADQLVRLSDKTGIGIVALQQLEGAAVQGGNTLDDVTSAIAEMQIRIAGEDKGLVKALKAVGLSLDDLRAMKPEQQFTTIAGAIQKVEDPADRAKLRVLAFGKAGKEIAGTLEQDFDAVAKSVTAMSDATARRLDSAGDTLQQYTKNVKAQIAEWLVQAVDFTRKAANAAMEGFIAVEVLFKQHIADMYKTAQTFNIAPGVGKKLAEAEKYWRDSAAESKSALAILIKKNDDFEASLQATAKSQKQAARTMLDLGEGANSAVPKLSDAERAQNAWNASIKAASEKMYWLTSDGSGLKGLIPLVQASATEAINAAREGNAWAYAMGLVSKSYAGIIKLPPVIKSLSDQSATAANKTSEYVVAIAKKMGDVVRNLGATLRSAFEGGGGITGAIQSIGVQIGDALAGSILDELAKKFQAGFAKAFAGVSTAGLLGVGTALSIIFSGWSAMNASAAEHKAIMAENARLYAATFAQYEADLKRVTAEYGELFDAVTAVKLARETDLYEMERQIPILREIIATQGEIKSKEQELADLQASLIPSWDDVSAAVSKYGLSIDGAGQKVQSMKVKSDATKLINDWEMLTRAGWDIAGLADGMKEELSAMVLEAQKYGVELPSNMKPILASMIAQGTLTDANGKALKDLAGIKFGEPVKSDADKIRDAMGEVTKRLGELIDKLADLAEASKGNADEVREHWRREPWADWRQPTWPNAPSPDDGDPGRGGTRTSGYATGTAGRYVPFGYKTRVDLHGDEAVVPKSQAPTLAEDIAARLNVSAGASVDLSSVVGAVRDEMAAMRSDLTATLRGLPRRMRDQLTLARAGAR